MCQPANLAGKVVVQELSQYHAACRIIGQPDRRGADQSELIPEKEKGSLRQSLQRLGDQ
ncbi:MAG: hypothetical protein O7G83_03785 [Proteobacteria bacterium]|nr:hypothetical protein [Pseudomonadota bacterium]